MFSASLVVSYSRINMFSSDTLLLPVCIVWLGISATPAISGPEKEKNAKAWTSSHVCNLAAEKLLQLCRVALMSIEQNNFTSSDDQPMEKMKTHSISPPGTIFALSKAKRGKLIVSACKCPSKPSTYSRDAKVNNGVVVISDGRDGKYKNDERQSSQFKVRSTFKSKNAKDFLRYLKILKILKRFTSHKEENTYIFDSGNGQYYYDEDGGFFSSLVDALPDTFGAFVDTLTNLPDQFFN